MSDGLEPLRLAQAPSEVSVSARAPEDVVADVLAARVAQAEAEGRRAGSEEALGAAAGALNAAAERLDEARVEAARELGARAVELAVEIARAVIAVEIEAGRHDIEALVRETLAAVGSVRGACTVHLNPADAQAVQGAALRAGTEIEADVEVPRGQVSISTPAGLLVRDPEELLAAISERILGDLH